MLENNKGIMEFVDEVRKEFARAETLGSRKDPGPEPEPGPGPGPGLETLKIRWMITVQEEKQCGLETQCHPAITELVSLPLCPSRPCQLTRDDRWS